MSQGSELKTEYRIEYRRNFLPLSDEFWVEEGDLSFDDCDDAIKWVNCFKRIGTSYRIVETITTTNYIDVE